MTDPLMRASHVHANLKALDALGEAAAQSVRALMKESSLQSIEDASRVAWLPLELDIELTKALHEAQGPGAVRQWSRDALRRSLDGPLLRPILEGSVRLFGLRPEKLFKHAWRAWGVVYRHCGELDLREAEPGHFLLRLQEAPAIICDDVYLEGVAGAFEAVFEICQVEGELRVEGIEPNLGQADFVADWRPAGP